MEKILIENNLTKSIIKDWLKEQIEECTDNDKFLSFDEFTNWKDEQLIGVYADEISYIDFVWLNERDWHEWDEVFSSIYNELIEEMKKEKEKKEKELDKEARDWLDYWQL